MVMSMFVTMMMPVFMAMMVIMFMTLKELESVSWKICIFDEEIAFKNFMFGIAPIE